MNELTAIETRRLRHEARRQLLDILCADADDAAQIGKRAVLLARLHGAPCLQHQTQRDLAAFLGVTEAAVSLRLKFLRETLL